MSNPNDPAYPTQGDKLIDLNTGAEQVFGRFPGLTKREAFAMAAMQGMCANPSIIGPNARCGWDYVNCTPSGLAQAAMVQADAQLAELAKEGGQ